MFGVCIAVNANAILSDSMIMDMKPPASECTFTTLCSLLVMTGTSQDEGITLPNAIPGVGGVTLGASVGHLAAQFAIGSALVAVPTWGVDGLALLASLAPNMVLQRMNLGEAPITALGECKAKGELCLSTAPRTRAQTNSATACDLAQSWTP